jgi:hypothetical protein
MIDSIHSFILIHSDSFDIHSSLKKKAIRSHHLMTRRVTTTKARSHTNNHLTIYSLFHWTGVPGGGRAGLLVLVSIHSANIVPNHD